MGTMRVKPWLVPTAAVLAAAAKAKDIKRAELAGLIGTTGSTVSNMMTGKSAVSPKDAAVLGRRLGIDPKSIVSPPAPARVRAYRSARLSAWKRRGGKRIGADGPRKAAMGPARKALVLHAESIRSAKPPPAILPPPPGSPTVFGMLARADGSTKVWLDVSLPADRGAALFRILLDFGLTGPGEGAD